MSQIEKSWPTVLKLVKIYPFFLQFKKNRNNSFLHMLTNAVLNFDFAGFKLHFLFELCDRHLVTFVY